MRLLAKNDAFVDGNKRIAFISMMLFLRKNGLRFAPDPAQATKIILSLAAGEVSEESLARWIRANWPRTNKPVCVPLTHRTCHPAPCVTRQISRSNMRSGRILRRNKIVRAPPPVA